MIHCALNDLTISMILWEPPFTRARSLDLGRSLVLAPSLVLVRSLVLARSLILPISESTVLKRNIDAAGTVPKMTRPALASLAQPLLCDGWITHNDTLRA